MFDRIRFLSGSKINQIFAHIDKEIENVYVSSSYQVLATMDDGISAVLTCSGYTGPFTEYTDMILKKGIIRVCSAGNNINQEGLWTGSNKHDFELVQVSDQDPFYSQLIDFLQYLDGEKESPVDGEYGLEMIKNVESCFKSNKSIYFIKSD